MSVAAPDFQDEVKNKNNEVTGTVIAIYVKDEITYLDVRDNDHIYYETPASNWETVVTCAELEGE